MAESDADLMRIECMSIHGISNCASSSFNINILTLNICLFLLADMENLKNEKFATSNSSRRIKVI
jgi:hypothetical protein